MFIKFSDKTPKMDAELAQENCCQICLQAVVLIDDEKRCGCSENNSLEKKAIHIFTQKIESTNTEK